MDSAGSSGVLLRTLARVKPARIVAVLDDERTEIAVRTGRTRWLAAAKAVAPLHAQGARIELLDAQGRLVESVEPPEVEGETTTTPRGGEERLLALMLRAQEVALTRHEKATSQLVDGLLALVKTQSERLSAMEKMHADVLEAAYEATVMAGEAAVKEQRAAAEPKREVGDEMAAQVLSMVGSKMMGPK